MNKIVRYSITAMVVMLLCGCGKVEITEEKTDEEIREDVNEALTEMISEATASEAPTEETEELPDDYLTNVVKNDSWDDFNYVKFGMQEQDGNDNNGPEYIDWEVLEKNNEEVVLISRQKLARKAINGSDFDEVAMWEDCTLRSWLNSDFYNDVFSIEEQGEIKETTHEDGTKDKVYILSVDEFKQYCEIDRGFIFSARQLSGDGYYRRGWETLDFPLRSVDITAKNPVSYVKDVTGGYYDSADELVGYGGNISRGIRPVIRVTLK